MFHFLKHGVVRLIVFLLPRRLCAIVGSSLLYRVQGDNDDNPKNNGEYYFLKKVLSSVPGKTIVFDVGANIGEWSQRAAALIGDDSVVYAFEPVKLTFEALSHKALEKVKAFNLALGKSDGEAEIYTSTDYAGSNSLVFNAYVGHTRKTEKVTVRTGDSFCKEKNIERINLLKIDTEGYEMNVLNGFQGLLTEGRVDFVQFEYGGTWICPRLFLKDAFTFFHEKGYALYKLHCDCIEMFEAYDPKSETFLYSNWIAVRKGIALPIRIILHK